MARRTRTVPRKAPIQARAHATLDTILQGAARVLISDGFDRASTNRIADKAGVSIGTLYQYFPSKEAIVAALIERHTEAMFAEISTALGRVMTLPLAQAVRQMVELMLRAHDVDPVLHRVLTEQVPRVGRLDRIFAVEEHVTEMVRAYLDVHRNEITVRDLDTGAFIVVRAVEALTHLATLHRPEQISDPAFADEVSALVVGYLTTPRKRAKRVVRAAASAMVWRELRGEE